MMKKNVIKTLSNKIAMIWVILLKGNIYIHTHKHYM